MDVKPFVIFALPRSRTAWLSRFLSCGGWHCGHEELRHCRSLDDVKAWFAQPLTGTVETAASPWWRLLKHYAPNARVVVIRRPVPDVVDSLMRLGLSFDRDALARTMSWMDRKLGQIAKRVPGALLVDYADLNEEAACRAIFEHCLSLPHDHERWEKFHAANLQIDMSALMRYAKAYEAPLERLGQAAKAQTLSLMARHKPINPDGVTFQIETFDAWVRDAAPLFPRHCVTVGEDMDQWTRKNIPLMRSIYETGGMQIMTARCNGRVFGYLLTLLSPSLVSSDMLSATNTTFFAAPEFPGLGLKLQRAAIRSLKERRVGEVFFEAGKRGDGPRLGSMYRRLGAVEHGQTYRLSLEA